MTAVEGGSAWLGDPKRVVGNQASVPVAPDSCEENGNVTVVRGRARQQRRDNARSEHVWRPRILEKGAPCPLNPQKVETVMRYL